MAGYLENSNEDGVVIASISGVYGDKWETFYVMCPETDRSTAAQAIGAAASTLPDLQPDGSDNAIIYKNDDEIGYELFEVTTMQLCSGGMAPLVYEFTADLVSISPSVNTHWWLNSRDLEQVNS